MRLPLLLALFLAIIDQATKLAVLASLQAFEVRPITSFFNLVLVFNSGAAFSFLSNASGWQNYFFMGVAILAMGLILYLMRQSTVRGERWGYAFILSGALGNFIDRVRLGKVVDFLDVHAFGYHWPAFNVADSAISLGVIGLLIYTFRSSKNRHAASQ